MEHKRWLYLSLPLLLSMSVCPGCGADTDAGNQMVACDVAMRFIVTDPGNGERYGGSGRVLDRQTGLVWMRYPYYPAQTGQNQTQAMSYCSALGMRLPAKEEAVAIGMHEATCAWPTNWSTWTSTISGDQAGIAFSDGASIMAKASSGSWGDGSDGGDVLCVR